MTQYKQGRQGVPLSRVPEFEFDELRIKTVVTSHSKPGRLVIRDTDDNHCTIAGDDALNVLGWLGQVGSHDDSTDFTTEDWVRIGHLQGTVVTLTLITGQTVTKGLLLNPAANGMVKLSAADPNPKLAICRAWESVTTGTLSSAPIIVKWGV
jgi:hypothetical protein